MEKIKNLGVLNTSYVKNMSHMFADNGENAPVINVDDLNRLDTSNVTNMMGMFNKIGKDANFSINCSQWNVDKVTEHLSFNYEAESKAVSPQWKH